MTIPTKLFHLVSRWQRGKTLGVRVAAIQDNRRVMLVRHGYSKGWLFPGGGVERRETMIFAAQRELREETGLIIKQPPQLIGIYANEVAFPGDHVALYVVREFEQAVFTPGFEIREARFFDLAELPADLTDATRARLPDAISGIASSEHWRP